MEWAMEIKDGGWRDGPNSANELAKLINYGKVKARISSPGER